MRCCKLSLINVTGCREHNSNRQNHTYKLDSCDLLMCNYLKYVLAERGNSGSLVVRMLKAINKEHKRC